VTSPLTDPTLDRGRPIAPADQPARLDALEDGLRVAAAAERAVESDVPSRRRQKAHHLVDHDR